MNNYIIYDEIGRGKHSVVHKVNSKGPQEEINRIFCTQELRKDPKGVRAERDPDPSVA
jgi:hypothetical protein